MLLDSRGRLIFFVFIFLIIEKLRNLDIIKLLEVEIEI